MYVRVYAWMEKGCVGVTHPVLPVNATFNIAVYAAPKGLSCGDSFVRELPKGNQCKLIVRYASQANKNHWSQSLNETVVEEVFTSFT